MTTTQDEIVALLREDPALAAYVRSLRASGATWPEVVSALSARADRLTKRAARLQEHRDMLLRLSFNRRPWDA